MCYEDERLKSHIHTNYKLAPKHKLISHKRHLPVRFGYYFPQNAGIIVHKTRWIFSRDDEEDCVTLPVSSPFNEGACDV